MSEIDTTAPVPSSVPVLRPRQDQGICDLREFYRGGGKRPIFRAPTGFGKSVMIGYMASQVVSRGGRVLVMIDSLELVEQLLATLESFDIRAGVMQAQHERTDSSRRCQIATAQTLTRRFESQPTQWGPSNYPVDFFIVDEAHIQHRARDEFMAMYPDCKVVGFSATPYSRGLGLVYDGMVSSAPVATLIAEGWLAPFTCFAPDIPNLTGVSRNAAGDWNANEVAARYDEVIHGSVIETWQKRASDRSTLGFARTVDHSKTIVAEFRRAGIDSIAHIDGYGGSEEEKDYRADTIRRFKSGDIQIVFNVALLTKGFDSPRIGAIIDCAPTRSRMVHLQRWGRGLRTGGPHSDLVVLDHSGNSLRIGTPLSEMPDELDDGTKKPDESPDRKQETDSLPVPCVKCSAHKPSGRAKCAVCGHEPIGPVTIENVAGELVEISSDPLLADAELAARKKAANGDKEKRKRYDWTKAPKKTKQSWWSQIQRLKIDRGWSDGRAAHVYRDRFTVWPRSLDDAPAPTVGPHVARFVDAKNIAWAKSERAKKKRGEAA